MPSWTTGGTDVICEKETDDGGESVRDGGEESGGDKGRERDRGRERKRDAMRQGYRDERKASLSLLFFQYPLLMKFHLDCKCSVIYHHKCVMGP